jgi:superfamily II DNA or RNA helicase
MGLYSVPYGPIDILGSSVVIHNYSPGDNQRLEHLFSVWSKVKHRYESMGVFYDYEHKDLYLPGGVNLANVINSFQPDLIRRIPPDPYKHIGEVKCKIKPRDDRQWKALKFCLGLEEYSNNRNCSQLSLNLNTGVGKTAIAVLTFAFYGLRTIMITASAAWLDQWREKLLEYTNLKPDEIYTISGTAGIVKLFNGMKKTENIKFLLCTHSTLHTYAKKHGWGSVRKLFMDLQIGIKVVDESHLFWESMFKCDYASNCLKTYYLTATPMKSDVYQNRIYQLSFETVPKISLFDEEHDTHANVLIIKINSHPGPYEREAIATGNYGFNVLKYVDYFQQTDIYYKLLHITLYHCLSEMGPEDRVLIYHATNSAVMQSYRWIKYHYGQYSIGIYTSLVPKEIKHEQLECKIILSTTKSAQALLDIAHLKKIIVFAEPYNSAPITRQVLGRLRDDNTELIEIVDVGFMRLFQWGANRKNIYQKYAKEVNEMQFNDQEINDAVLQINRAERAELEERVKGLPLPVEYVNK